jgi:hypothetical protein
MIVHFMHQGVTACLVNGPPSSWPDDHKWSTDWKDITCGMCLAGRNLIITYKISDDGKSITCLRCKTVSEDPKDVEQHFCPYCQTPHDDLWPPCRKAWIEKRDIPVEPS